MRGGYLSDEHKKQFPRRYEKNKEAQKEKRRQAVKKKFASGIATRGSPANLKEGSCKSNALTMEQALNMETAGMKGAGGVKKGVMKKVNLKEGCHGGGNNFPRM